MTSLKVQEVHSILPSPLSQSMGENETVKDTCVICLEEITEKAVADPCSHGHFDFLCLMSWLLEEGPQCPLCRANVKQVRYAFESPTGFKTYHTIPRTAHSTSKSSTRTLPLRRRRRPLPRAEPDPDPALLRRKHIYRQKLYSLHVGASAKTGYRNITARIFSQSPDLQSKATKWIRRELSIFEFLNIRVKNTEYLLKYIITILKHEDIKGSNGVAEDLVQEFLGRENARLFLHELEAWLRSPYESLREWDEAVQYRDILSSEVQLEASLKWDRGKQKVQPESSEERLVQFFPPSPHNSRPHPRTSQEIEDPEREGYSQYPLLFQDG